MKILKSWSLFLLICLTVLTFTLPGQALQTYQTLTSDGAWCWFGDPRGLYYHGTYEKTYMGWLTSTGHVIVGSYNHATGELSSIDLGYIQVDDHANPSVFMRNDGRLMVFYSGHNTGDMFYRIANNPEDISSWGSVRTVPDGGFNVTYPNPFQLANESNKMFLFWRGIDWQPTMSTSTDGGLNWTTPVKVFQAGARPYAKYESDGLGKIHFAFTTGHPRNEPQNKIYYGYYYNGAYYRANGTFIKNVSAGNLVATDLDLVYNASAGKGWIWDIALDSNGYPVLVYAAFPADNQHYYRYARWNGSAWEDHPVTFAGTWFPQTPTGTTEPEPNYSGGIMLDHNNPSIVYLSRQVNGIFEIEKWTTSNGGTSWSSVSITSGSTKSNVRPFVPRKHKAGEIDVIWMNLSGRYVHYTNYLTSLMMYSPNAPAGNNTRFDLGTATSPVESGYTGITETTTYSTGSYGWTNTTGNQSRDRASGNNLQRDFVFNTTARVFKVDLANGTYDVKILQGDATFAHDNMVIKANGVTKATVNTAIGQWITTTFPMTISGGTLELEFSDTGGTDVNWVVNAIEITTTGPTPTPTPTPTATPVNLALNKPVTCSSEQVGNEASHAVDGDLATRWSADTYPEWIQVDLGSAMNINKVEVAPYLDRAYQYKVEVATSASGPYTQVVDRLSNTTGGSVITDTFTTTSARYVKMTVTGCYGYTGTWTSILELRVFGP